MKSKRIVLVVLAALVALSAFGVVSAQGLEQRRGGEGQRGEGRWAGRHPMLRGIQHIASVISEATGLERAEIVAQLAEGKTIAEIVTENGGDVDDVKAELLAPLVERAATAVENEHITQERADELLASASERLDTLLDRVFERLTEFEFPRGRRGVGTANEI